MQTDVKAKTMTTTGAAAIGPARIKGMYLVNAGSAGSVVIRDGGASGTIVLDLATAANTTGTGDTSVFIPGDGIRCSGDPHLTITNVTSVTLFYG